jgi:thiol-disulfide isomerase/thioredoxin
MKNTFITSYKKSLAAEWIKKRGTGMVWLSVLIGLFVPTVDFIVRINKDQLPQQFPFDLTIQYLNNAMTPFAAFFFPLLIILVSTRLSQLDHRHGGWQLMETLPVHKFGIYLSKFTLLLLCNLICIVALLLGVTLFSALQFHFFEVQETAQLPLNVETLQTLLYRGLRMWIATLGLSSLLFAISVLVPSFIWGLLIGFSGFIISIALKAQSKFYPWNPYQQLSTIIDHPESLFGHFLLYTDWLSIGLFIFTLWAGYQWYSGKTLRRAFAKNSTTVALSLVLLVVFVGYQGWMLQTKQSQPYGQTVLSVQLKDAPPLHQGVLYDLTLNDTVAILPFKDNKAHLRLDQPIRKGTYYLTIDDQFQTSLHLQEGDSIYIEGSYFKNAVNWKPHNGSLKIENQFTYSIYDQYVSQANALVHYGNLTETPAKIAEKLHALWMKSIHNIRSNRSGDNYILRESYADEAVALKTFQYLMFWENYSTQYHALHQIKNPETPALIKEIEDSVELYDERFSLDQTYIDYLKKKSIASDDRKVPLNIKWLDALVKMPNETIKNHQMYLQLKNDLTLANDRVERIQVMDQYASSISDTKLHNRIQDFFQIQLQIGKGEPFPDFAFEDAAGNPKSLDAFKGKFVIIDLWATWCGPCKYQQPYFSGFAIKYQESPVEFVAISIDRDHDAWLKEVPSHDQNIHQWYVRDTQGFSKKLDVQSIPRFIFLDQEGKFINNQLPFPDTQNFEYIIKPLLTK